MLPATCLLLFGPALRATALGMAVWSVQRLARLRDTRTEIAIWTAVLVASICMPLLCWELPNGITLPSFSTTHPPDIGLIFDTRQIPTEYGIPPFHAAQIPSLLWAIYGAVATISLIRLAMGLILTLNLYRTSCPITASWAVGRAIRAGAKISSPISIGFCILLPSDYGEWPETKLLAVLAHEQSHIRRGDFFIQLLASFHRTIFWFSPFAWWLQRHLAELAEVASDEAVVRELNDPISYAEILIDVSQSAQGWPAQIAMAKGPNVFWRVDRILKEQPHHDLSVQTRCLAVGTVVSVACLFAGAHAATTPLVKDVLQQTFTRLATNETPTIRTASPVAPHRHVKAHKASPGHPRIAYNPRALLEDDDVVVVKALVPTSTKGPKKRSADTAVIMNMSGLSGD